MGSNAERNGNSGSSSSSGGGRGGGGGGNPAIKPEGGFATQDEGVLHTILEDIREWRVSSTLVDDPNDGEKTVDSCHSRVLEG